MYSQLGVIYKGCTECIKDLCGGGISYRTTRTEAFILDCSSRLCSKLMRTMFFWKHKTKSTVHVLHTVHLQINKKAKWWVGAVQQRPYQINTKVSGEHHSCKTKIYFQHKSRNEVRLFRKWAQFFFLWGAHIAKIKTKRMRKAVPPSTWTRPRSRRMCTDCSDRVGFAADSLKDIKCWVFWGFFGWKLCKPRYYVLGCWVVL